MIDLNPRHLATVERILAEHAPGLEVRAFGSRATWTAKEYSDLDLALVGQSRLDTATIWRLKEAFSESDLPIRVDVLDWHAISDKFREAIRPDCVELVAAANEPSTVQLADVATITMGQSPPGSTYNEDEIGLPFFQGVKDFNYRYPTPRVYCSEPSRIAQPGDILFSVRAPIGRVNVADRECATGRGVAIIKPRVESDARYLEFALRYLEQSWGAIEGSGSVFGNATKRDLESLLLPWPESDSERGRIAGVLGCLDDKIELNRRMAETLEEMARALFRSWFVDFEPVRAKQEGRWRSGESLPGLPAQLYESFPDRLEPSPLGPIPAGWQIAALGDLCHKPQYGYTASADDEPVGPKFLRIKDINKSSWIDWASVPHCPINEGDVARYRLRSGDIVIARMADPGHGALIEEDREAVFASYLIRFRPLDQAYARFLQYWLRSDAYWELVAGRRTGTTRANLNAKTLAAFPLATPPQDIAASFGELITSLRTSVVAVSSQSQTLAAQRDTLLPKLMSANRTSSGRG